MQNTNTNNTEETRKKIIEILKSRGPSLPVHIASPLGLSSIFAGAFLAELVREKIIKISNMKVGGSPLYFLQGQEVSLEKFHPYLPGKEKEAFLLLKKHKISKDSKQEPAIRVALRNLRDFAMPFSQDNEVWWRFHSITEREIIDMFEKPKKKIKQKVKLKPKEAVNLDKEKTLLDIGLEKTKEKQKKPKTKSDFVVKVIDFLNKENIEILEEVESKKKEFTGKIKIDSILGKINFLCIAKDKKRITENDLRLILQKAQGLKVPALVIYPEEINKKAEKYAETWSSLLKLKKLE